MLTFNKWLNRIFTVVTALAVIAMMFHVVAHALTRFLFSAPLYGTNEIVAFWYLPVVALLGIPAAQLQKEHITVTLVVERIGDTAAATFKILGCVLGALLAFGFAWFGLGEALKNMSVGSTAGVTSIVTWPVYFLVPVVFFSVAALYVLEIFAVRDTGDPEGDLIAREQVGQTLKDTGL